MQGGGRIRQTHCLVCPIVRLPSLLGTCISFPNVYIYLRTIFLLVPLLLYYCYMLASFQLMTLDATINTERKILLGSFCLSVFMMCMDIVETASPPLLYHTFYSLLTKLFLKILLLSSVFLQLAYSCLFLVSAYLFLFFFYTPIMCNYLCCLVCN